MKYWLLKSEEDSYSIDDLKRDKSTLWENIRNYRARNIMRDEMSPGDLFLFYYSMGNPAGAIGVGRVLQVGLPDASALDKNGEYYDPKATKGNNPWVAPKIGFMKKFKRLVTIDEIKKDKRFKNMILLKIARLSVQPVTAEEFKLIEGMGNK